MALYLKGVSYPVFPPTALSKLVSGELFAPATQLAPTFSYSFNLCHRGTYYVDRRTIGGKFC